MQYIEIEIQLEAEWHELAIAMLSDLALDSFLEDENVLKAYAEESVFNTAALEEVLAELPVAQPVSYTFKQLEKVNWNKEWESNFDPVYVDDQVHIRASFHEKEAAFPYEIVINPRMSFGTGHHQTTHLMVKSMLDLDLKGKRVYDVGTGTGVLAIFAHLKGAAKIDTCDIDEWSVDNSAENYSLNHADEITIAQGTFEECRPANEQYDIILANINLNVLLKEVPDYANALTENAYLVLSGFYVGDVAALNEVVVANGLHLVQQLEKDDWTALTYQKQP